MCVSGTEDRKLLRIVLSKSNRDAANCWRSLLEGQYAADAHVFDQMERKLTLERFQNEVRTVEPDMRTFELLSPRWAILSQRCTILSLRWAILSPRCAILSLVGNFEPEVRNF